MFRRLLSIAVFAVLPAVAFAQQPCTPDARHVVDDLYRHMLERSADPSSAGWVDKLQSGTTVREIVRQIATSPEHMQRFYNPAEGAVANERAVGTLYRHLLGRQPDAAAARAWADTASRTGLAAVVDSILNSAPYNQTVGDCRLPASR